MTVCIFIKLDAENNPAMWLARPRHSQIQHGNKPLHCLNLTKLDILDDFPEMPVAIGYRVDGEILDSFPTDLQLLERAEIVYKNLPGWKKPSTGAKAYYDLPPNARSFVDFIEEIVGIQVKYIGTGPARGDMIMRPDRRVVKADEKKSQVNAEV